MINCFIKVSERYKNLTNVKYQTFVIKTDDLMLKLWIMRERKHRNTLFQYPNNENANNDDRHYHNSAR